jgi:hypothetical protein
MEPSLRESIEQVAGYYTEDGCDCVMCGYMRVVLAAARERADEIDNEDPEGMQDRNCGTCKYSDLEETDDPCTGCFTSESAERPNWEPMEVDV